MDGYLFHLTPNDGQDIDEVEVGPTIWLLGEEEVPPLLLSVEQVARCLGIDVEAMTALVAEARVEVVTIAGEERIPIWALVEQVRGRCAGETT
jgi:hypothetical protein